MIALVLAFGFTGCDTSSDDDDPSQNKLTITGDLDAAYIMAFIYESLADIVAQEPPVAVAGNVSKSFAFYEPTATMAPDLTKQWKSSGEFYVLLTTGTSDPVQLFATSYISNGKIKFKGNTVIRAWLLANFTLLKDYQEPTVITPFTLTVTGIDASASIMGGAVIANFGGGAAQETIAVGVNNDGIFKFYLPNLTIPTMPMPTTTPWKGEGSYTLVLSPLSGKQWVYTDGKGLAGLTELFDFSVGSATLTWDKFTQLP